MKDQTHNQGNLKELKVMIEENVVTSFELMSQNTGIELEELIVVALKRFRASHSDYEKKTFQVD
ncbi:hypothetical protein ACRXCV_00985 [Halobacteriovorax sp. GFR7]|uniref:hypothetical protein n=1 Tax=Bacteriovoracales TaxID=2024979 RepID=UPI0003867C6F|nr:MULTISPECIES: hypothetical protein [Bacteriovoracales]EPZ50577.1 hypothetical protein M902_1563 [Bacteriovorax sp. BAL6_X]POB13265.1 hypothetical protein C0Z22_12185 [Halobacteriovorax sp. DA5]